MRKHIRTYTPKELLPYIDWSYLLHAWGVNGSDKQSEARQIKAEAKALLDEDCSCDIKALFCLHEAHSDGDNIIVGEQSIPLLRQQHTKADKPNLCLSDFISPVHDHIGFFATSVHPHDTDKNCSDPYKQLLTDTMYDRLAEAAATLLHREVRTNKELWGYNANEQLSIPDMISEKQQGIRPAIGYPSLPDQSIIFLIDSLIDLSLIGIELTDNGAMYPHASVCGLMFAHPAAHYFSIGKISKEQITDYAQRRGMPIEQLMPYLVKNIQ